MVTKKRHRVSYYDDPVLLGQRIRKAREALSLSQRELSFPGCTAAYISRIEKGERVPSLQLIREFAVRLRVSEQYISHGRHDGIASDAADVEARVALRLGELETARELADAALAAARSPRDRARANALVGEIELQLGNSTEAIDALERAWLLDESLEEADPTFGETFGRAYARALDLSSAIAVFERNRERAAAARDVLNEIRFSTLLGNAHVEAGDIPQAEQALARAIELSETVADRVEQARLLWAESRRRAQRGEPAGAARFAQRALVILDASEDALSVGLAHLLLAHIELDRGAPDRAVALLDRGEPIIAASGRRFELASLRIEHARALTQLGRRDEAAAAAAEARGLMAGLNALDAGRGYALIAEVCEGLGDEEQALELYELAIARLEERPSRHAVDAYSKLAGLLERRGEKDAAFEVLKRAVQVQRRAERVDA